MLFTDEEMKAMNARSTGEIAIQEFIPADRVGPEYIERANYLGPDKGAARSYHLLAEAMRMTGRSALAKYAARGKSYLVLIQPENKGLIMIQLRHHEELRRFSEVEIPDAEIKQEELDLAVQLVEQVASDEFHPENYVDEVRDYMLEVIDQKVHGEEIVAAEEEQPEAKIIDIMEALKASLKEQEGKPAKAKRAPKKKAKQKAKSKASRK